MISFAECPSEFRSDRLGTVAANKKGAITVDTLAELRTRLNTLKAAYRAAQAKVEGTKILAYTLEDIVAAKNDPGANTIHWSLYDTDSTTAQYNWHIHYKPMWLKFQAICFFILSAFSFLGVVCSMHGVDNKASVYYLAVHDTDSGSRGGIAIFILITLGYTTYITTWALFQAKISASMELVPHRTTPLALSFNVRMVARLAAPLAFFYLGWLAENGIQNGDWTRNKAPGFYNSSIIYVNDSSTNFTLVAQNVTQYWRNSISMPSAFSNFYQLQSVGIIKQTFGTIFPIMLFCVLFLFLTNAFNRLLVLLKMDKYQFGAALVTEEQLREGRRQLQRTKKATVRHRYHIQWSVEARLAKPATPQLPMFLTLCTTHVNPKWFVGAHLPPREPAQLHHARGEQRGGRRRRHFLPALLRRLQRQRGRYGNPTKLNMVCSCH